MSNLAYQVDSTVTGHVDYICCQFVCCCGEQVILLWQLRISANTEGRTHQGQVTSMCVLSMQQLVGSGACSPRNILEFRCAEVASETIFRPKEQPDDRRLH